MDNVMVTNNCRCFEKWKDIFQMEFEEGWTYLMFLQKQETIYIRVIIC